MRIEGGYNTHALTSVIKGARPFVDQAAQRFRKPPPDTLHHYTAGGKLLDILKGKRFWATHVSCLNDSTELRHAWKVFSEACEGRDTVGNPGATMLVAEFRKRLPGEPVTAADVYVACFSKERDDLSQWRAYGGDASVEGGYMLTFDGPSLTGRLTAPNTHPWLAEVEYDPGEQRGVMRSLAAYVFDQFPRWTEYLRGVLPMEVWVRDYATIWFGMLAEIAPCMKHPAFEGEKEWRLIAAYPGSAPVRPKLEFSQRSAMVSRHLPLGDGETPLPVRGVLVGSSRHKDVSRSSLGLALREWGYTEEEMKWKVGVDASETPVQTP